MSYTRQFFTDGQVLEAQHLNKMEVGIKGAEPLVIKVVCNDSVYPEEYTSDATLTDVLAALDAGRLVMVVMKHLVGYVHFYPWRYSLSRTFVCFSCPFLYEDSDGKFRTCINLRVDATGWSVDNSSPFY